ncbi:hypothetical protein DB345_05230 [Spartobacteria bacterium LR76]|nr:hypothetical protein DB345_05230 [Spartobacteria bacterium LR76]
MNLDCRFSTSCSVYFVDARLIGLLTTTIILIARILACVFISDVPS